MHELAADWPDLFAQGSTEHHDLLLMGGHAKDFLDIPTHVCGEDCKKEVRPQPVRAQASSLHHLQNKPGLGHSLIIPELRRQEDQELYFEF